MSFTQDNVKKLAHLSRLAVYQNTNKNNTSSSLSDKQLQFFENSIVENLNSIINMIEQINELNTDNVKPMSHPLETNQRMRKDEVTEPNMREEMQDIIANDFKNAGLYLVPKIIE